jgi:hypothetical protein
MAKVNNEIAIHMTIAAIIIVIMTFIVYYLPWERPGIPVDISCARDTDCACGTHISTGECFHGNRNYVNTLRQCPNYCPLGINQGMICVDNICRMTARQ